MLYLFTLIDLSLISIIIIHEGKAEEDKEYDLLIEVCGVKQAVMDNLHVLKPGGLLILVGLCVPNSALDITAEKIIRNCWTLLGN